MRRWVGALEQVAGLHGVAQELDHRAGAGEAGRARIGRPPAGVTQEGCRLVDELGLRVEVLGADLTPRVLAQVTHAQEVFPLRIELDPHGVRGPTQLSGLGQRDLDPAVRLEGHEGALHQNRHRRRNQRADLRGCARVRGEGRIPLCGRPLSLPVHEGRVGEGGGVNDDVRAGPAHPGQVEQHVEGVRQLVLGVASAGTVIAEAGLAPAAPTLDDHQILTDHHGHQLEDGVAEVDEVADLDDRRDLAARHRLVQRRKLADVQHDRLLQEDPSHAGAEHGHEEVLVAGGVGEDEGGVGLAIESLHEALDGLHAAEVLTELHAASLVGIEADDVDAGNAQLAEDAHVALGHVAQADDQDGCVVGKVHVFSGYFASLIANEERTLAKNALFVNHIHPYSN